MARKFPKCESCGRSILEKNVAEGRDADGVHYYHVAHRPKGKGEKPRKNIFFRHRLRERRLRRQLEQAAGLQAQAASTKAAESVAALGSKNPHYPAIPGKAFERKWERLVLHVKDSGSAYSPWAVATATLGGYPASRARRNPALRKLGRGVRSFRGRVTRFGRKHKKATRALRTAGKVAAGAATAAVPEVAVPVRAIRGGVSAYRKAKGRRRARPRNPRSAHHRRNPTLSRPAYLTQQLDRAKMSADAGRPAEAHKYIDRVVRIVTGAHGDPDENATFLSRARTIEQQIEAGSKEMGRREKALRKMEESLPSLELAHEPPPDPDDEFWGQLAAEAQRRFPGRNLSGAVNDLQYLWHYGIGNRAKHNVVNVWNRTHTLDAINEAFWQVFELYLDRKMKEVGGKLVPKEEVGGEVRAVMKNPGKHPIVHGATAVELTYRDRNGVLWTHDFGEDSRETRLHVRKGLTSDAVVLKPTQVTEAGIGDS